jgi:hypothetical protein
MYYYITLFLLFFSLTACVNVEQKNITPSQKKQSHVIKLNKEVKKLDSHDKRLIYQSIKNEINLYNKKGDEDYKYGYYYDAIKAYELVNFYEGSNAIALKKLNHIKTLAKKRASFHYIKAQHYLPSKKKKALIELNSVMMNNPHYKDTKLLYKTIKNTRDIKIYLNTLQNSLETQLLNNEGSFKELKSIQKGLNNLEKYDYKNSAIKKARQLLKERKAILLKNSILTYQQKRLKKAKKNFYEILSLYPHDITAEQYIRKIDFRQNKTYNLYLAKQSLKQNHYLQAQSYAKKVLQLEKENKEALQIIADAQKKSKEAVNRYVKEGKKAYNNKNLDTAKQYFEKALDINKTNNTALIYHKRIQRQLQTIKSLQ